MDYKLVLDDFEGPLELLYKLVKKNEIKKMMKIIKDEMISVANSDYHSFSTPLTVDVNVGDNWGMLH